MLVVLRLGVADCEPTGLAVWPAAVLRVTPLSKMPIFPSCPQLPSVALPVAAQLPYGFFQLPFVFS